MKFEDCKVGMVVVINNYIEDLGTITHLNTDMESVTVQYLTGGTYTYYDEDLEPYDEPKVKAAVVASQSALDEATSLFEQAFAKLQEARKTAEDNDLYIHNKKHFNYSKLEDVIESNGWNASGLWC